MCLENKIMVVQNINFDGRKKIIDALKHTPKTPRAFQRKNLELALTELGYKLDRIAGSHRIFRNEHGDILSIAAAGNVVDPKSVKQVQNIIKQRQNHS